MGPFYPIREFHSANKSTKLHSTLRGFNSTGDCTFTIHLMDEPTRDEVFVYTRAGSAVLKGTTAKGLGVAQFRVIVSAKARGFPRHVLTYDITEVRVFSPPQLHFEAPSEKTLDLERSHSFGIRYLSTRYIHRVSCCISTAFLIVFRSRFLLYFARVACCISLAHSLYVPRYLNFLIMLSFFVDDRYHLYVA